MPGAVTKLLVLEFVTLPVCRLCTYLLGRVTRTAKKQIEALTGLTEAVINTPEDDAAIAALKRTLKRASLSRSEAVEQYESHLLTHSEKVFTAGQSQD